MKLLDAAKYDNNAVYGKNETENSLVTKREKLRTVRTFLLIYNYVLLTSPCACDQVFLYLGSIASQVKSDFITMNLNISEVITVYIC